MSEEKKLSVAQRMGITRSVIRPREEADIRIREDRIGRYFKKYLDKFIFVEFSDEFLEKSKVKDIMKGVPIPLRKRDLNLFEGGKGLSATHIGENMAWVMGCDPGFKYTEQYVQYLRKLFNYKIYEGMLKEGRDAAEREDFDNACIHFRAALCMQFDYMHGMYSYARVCRSMYLASSDEEYVGRFKAEALDWFELLTETHPRFAQGYYYLGYAYLNMGLYAKAEAAWKWFLSFSHNGKDKKEVRNRIEQIKEPIAIEAGCNDIMTGRFDRGLETLQPFLDSKYKDWWPLHYYIGVGCARTGNIPEAVSRFKATLGLNASHLETMRELMEIYRSQGDKENYTKYEKKVDLIQADLKQEALERGEQPAKYKTANDKPAATSKKKLANQKAAEKAKAKDARLKEEAEKEAENEADKKMKSGIKRLGN